MRGVNKAIILGNLGQDPEVRYTQNELCVCNFSVATTYKNKDQQYTEWHRVSTFGKLAEIAGQYLKKGSTVFIEGRLQTRKWQDKQGNDRYTTEIIASEMSMMGKNEGNVAPAPVPEQRPLAVEEPEFDDSIPF